MSGGRAGREGVVAGRKALLAPAALALVYVALRLWRLTDSCLWFDEIFGVHAARHPWADMLRFVAADAIHPPLFYALLKVWTAAGGESLLWLRLLPVALSAAALAPLLLLCRELRLANAETNLALLLFALNGHLVKYAHEVRMYALLLLLALCSLWLVVRFANSRRESFWQLAALSAVNLLLVYTHYYGWLVVASGFAFLLAFAARRKLVRFALVVALVAAGFAPWVYAAARAGGSVAQNIGWIARPGPGALAQTYLTANELLYYQQASHEPPHLRLTAPLALLLFGLPLLLLAWRGPGGRTRADDARAAGDGAGSGADARARAVPALALFALLPVALAFLLSHALPHSVWGARHLVVAAAPYLVLVGVALARLRPAWLRAGLLAALGCWALLNASFLLLRGPRTYVWCAWEPLARRLSEDARARGGASPAPGSLPAPDAALKVYAFEEAVAYHVWFALSSAPENRFAVEVVRGVPGVAEDPAYFLPRAFAGVRVRDAGDAFAEDFFYVAFRDAAWRADRPPLKFLAERGFAAGVPAEVRTSSGTAFLVPVSRTR